MPRNVRPFLCAVLAGFASLVGSATASAQVKLDAPLFVIDASDNENRVVVLSVRSFDLAIRDPGKPEESSPFARMIGACNPDALAGMTEEQLEQRNELLQRVHDCKDCLRAHQEMRFFTERGDHIALIVLVDATFPADAIRPVFRETERPSELLASARALAKISGREGGGLNCRAFTYTLQRKRSRLNVLVPDIALPPDTALGSPTAPPSPATGALKNFAPTASGAPAERGDITTPEVVLGPREHFFVSADMAFERSQFKLGKAPEADQDAIKNRNFFAALNFSVGDLLIDRGSPLQRRSIWQEVLFKLQVTLSQQPWEAWAVGVGLRGDRLKTLLWNMDVIHPYFSFGKQPDENDEKKKHWRATFGVGFDPRSLSR